MNAAKKLLPAAPRVRPHPAGGYTVAVRALSGTVRTYEGMYATPRAARAAAHRLACSFARGGH